MKTLVAILKHYYIEPLKQPAFYVFMFCMIIILSLLGIIK